MARRRRPRPQDAAAGAQRSAAAAAHGEFVKLSTLMKRAARETKDARIDRPSVTESDLKRGARIALDEWLRRYAKPDENDPIGLTDELLHELD